MAAQRPACAATGSTWANPLAPAVRRIDSSIERIDASGVVDHPVCECESLLARQLRSNTRPCVLLLEAPKTDESLHGNIDRGVHHENPAGAIARRLTARESLAEQRDVEDHQPIRRFQFADPPTYLPTDGRMRDGVQIGECVGVRKDDRGHRASVQRAVRRHDAVAESLHHLHEDGTRRRLLSAHDGIGVDEHCTPTDEALGHRALAAADAAGEADGDHQAASDPAGPSGPVRRS